MPDPLRHAEEIRASPQACLDALLDFDSYPEWQSAVLSAVVRDRDEDAGTIDVAFETDLRIRRIRYVLRYVLDGAGGLTWSRLEGDARRIDGGYTLEPLAGGLTLATYSLDIDAGIPVPGLIRRRLVNDSMVRSVRELKARVEPG